VNFFPVKSQDSGADGISQMLSNMLNVKQGSYNGPARSAIVAINDIRGLEGMNYSKNEKQLRCKLAAVYRSENHSIFCPPINTIAAQ